MKISQSCIKEYKDPDRCDYSWKRRWIDNDNPSVSNQMMDYGKYFEYLCIGGSANDDDNITDLPRKRNGDKSVIQLRIEEQAKRFKDLFNSKHKDYLGYKIVSSQKYLENKYQRGTIDIVAIDSDDQTNLIDIKLTYNVDFVRSWKSLSSVDDIQPIQYTMLYQSNFDVKPKFKYLVFDYSKEMKIKIFHVDVSSYNYVYDYLKKINNFISTNEDWGFNPSKYKCENCSLKCEFRWENL